MKLAKLVPILAVFTLTLTSLACPTRTKSGDADDDAASGSGGAGGASGAAGSSRGGASGAAGSGSGGAGGASGAAGSGSGGAGGASGAAGSGSGVAGASGGVKDGQPCSLAIDCASGVCTAFYVDVDGDGYGTGQAVGFCGANAPVGYAAQSGDCCDSASNLAVAKLIHPGADFQPTSAGGVCGITWDYDCSGTVESNPQSFMGCTPYPACTAIFADYLESSCGTPIDSAKFCAVAGPDCTMSVAGHPAVPIRCK